jgi:hypothetical protein
LAFCGTRRSLPSASFTPEPPDLVLFDSAVLVTFQTAWMSASG